MRLPRVRFTIRRMMILVLAVALVCGWLARQLYWRTLREEAAIQLAVTTEVMLGGSLGRIPGDGIRGTSDDDFSEPSPGKVRWFRTYKLGNPDTRLLDLEVSGGCDRIGLQPISVKDYGGTLNARLIEALTRAYRERGWRYVIMPLAGAGPDSQRIE